jgi:hypothetical protein
MGVKLYKFNGNGHIEYLKEHNIEEVVDWRKIYGCCIVKAELWDETGSTLVFERFDRVTQAVSLECLLDSEKDWRWSHSKYKTRIFKMINIRFNKDCNSGKYIKNYNIENYKPTFSSIFRYIFRYWKSGNETMISDLTVKATNMTKEQFNSIRSKAMIAGAECGLVDYNTFAIKNKDKVCLYSMQDDIKM